jgi:hypothetical protein
MNIALKIGASLNVTVAAIETIIIEQYFDKSAVSSVVNHFRRFSLCFRSSRSCPRSRITETRYR